MGSHPKTNDGNKQVRVDNWGVFFLQRLQNFFNKTDYCDLTLQFDGNVQLKVHRLVINACTEYFHVLEQTCEMIDDVLMMPADLQADVILPIVNFMYTGMLEFHTSVFDKLYQTANLMNIPILTKLLDAQRGHNSSQPKMLNKKLQNWSSSNKKFSRDSDLPAPLPGRKIPVWKRKSVPTSVQHSVVPHYYQEQKRAATESKHPADNKPKPTRFEWPEDDLSTLNVFENSFDEISYTSKPLVTQEDEPRPSTSFDRIRDSVETNQQQKVNDGYENLDIDMDDVRDYVKEQKIRSNINMEDDDHDFDNDYDSDGDDVRESQKRKGKFTSPVVKRVRFNANEKENQGKQTKINITPTGKVNSDVDHTKIISEVLKKYPNLVKKNKNIRLKILAKNNVSSSVTEEVKGPVVKRTRPVYSGKTVKAPFIEERSEDDGPWKCLLCSTPDESVEFVLYYLFRKHMTDVHSEKFDSRMCKYCGHKSAKLNMLAYHQYTRHCIKPPPAYSFPKCTRCPFIALNDTVLTRHRANHSRLEVQCFECKITFTNNQTLNSHQRITGHSLKGGQINYDCQYCIKKFPYGSNLFAHIRLQHLEDARRDGIVSLDEFEDELEEVVYEHDKYITPDITTNKTDKIKIIQDVKLPTIEQGTESLNRQNLTLEPSSEAEALSNVASGIATSLGLVDVVVLDDNQQYILHTENQGMASGGNEYIIPDIQENENFSTSQQNQNVITQSMLHGANIASTDELVMVLTDHDYGDGNNELINNENSKIVVLYSHPIDGSENQFITSQGNLMLTSQAGLIELRNGNTVVTSTGSHFITTSTESHENAHIESIEMIQREIDQHPNVQNEIHEDANLDQTDNVKSKAAGHSSEEEMSKMESEEAEPVLEMETRELHLEEASQSNGDEIQELHLEEASRANGDEIQELHLEEASQSNGDEIQELHLEEASRSNEDEIQELHLEEASRDNGDEIQELPKDDLDDSEVVHQQVDSSNEIDSLDYLNKEGTNASTEETHESANSDVVNDAEMINNVTSQEESQANTSEDVSQENISEGNTSGEGDVTEANTSHDISEKEPSQEVIEDSISKENTDDIAENESSPKADLNTTTEMDSSSVVVSLADASSDVPENANTTEIEIEKNEPESDLVAGTELKKPENEKPTEGDYDFNLKDGGNGHVEDESFCLQMQEEASNSSEIHEPQENSNMEQDTVQSQTEDETSQSSVKNSETENSNLELEAASTEKSVKGPIKKSNQSAKVILADWDDTDSQQSDSKGGSNVNKLIDDWDDDDEDKKDTE